MIELFLDFKKEKTQESFDKLDFIKKRHVFAEERAIIMLQSSDREFPEMLPVLEQHRVIGETMDRIRQNFISKLRDYEGDLDKVIDLMKKHVIFENKIFYPRLDRELNEKEKQSMFVEFNNIYRDFENKQTKLEKIKNRTWKNRIFPWLK